VVGKYIDLQDAYKSIYESLTHAAASHDCGIDLRLIDAESLEHGVNGELADVAGVLIPGGFGERGSKGKSARLSSRAKTMFPISGFVWECRWRRLSSLGTFAESPQRTAVNSTRNPPSRSSASG
jgi:hypothetical protein